MASFTENDIRPAHLNFDKEAAYARDVARLLRHKPDFLDVPCPACGSQDSDLKWTKNELTYRACRKCATVYVSPRPGPAALHDYYSNSELYDYWSRYIFPASEQVRRDKIFAPRLAAVLAYCDRYAIEPGTLIEVGPGFGTFCELAMASQRFRNVIAIEPTPSLAAACRDRGIAVIEKPVEDVDLAETPANVVAAFEVIEHLLDPGGFVEAVARSVAPGGLLVLTCPNVAGFEVEVLGQMADTVDAEHLNYFNPKSLALLVQSRGFEILEVSTPGMLDADIVRNKVLAGKFDLSGQRFLEIVLIDRWEELKDSIQAFLRENVLSSHMWLVARRFQTPRASGT
jgi:SAM-dependent methyltransferase